MVPAACGGNAGKVPEVAEAWRAPRLQQSAGEQRVDMQQCAWFSLQNLRRGIWHALSGRDAGLAMNR